MKTKEKINNEIEILINEQKQLFGKYLAAKNETEKDSLELVNRKLNGMIEALKWALED